MLKTPILTAVSVFAVVLVVSLLVSSWLDRRKLKRIMELKERSRRQHQLELQRMRQASVPNPPATGPVAKADVPPDPRPS